MYLIIMLVLALPKPSMPPNLGSALKGLRLWRGFNLQVKNWMMKLAILCLVTKMKKSNKMNISSPCVNGHFCKCFKTLVSNSPPNTIHMNAPFIPKVAKCMTLLLKKRRSVKHLSFLNNNRSQTCYIKPALMQ